MHEQGREDNGLVPEGAENVAKCVQQIVSGFRRLCGHPDNWYPARVESRKIVIAGIQKLKPFITEWTYRDALRSAKKISVGIEQPNGKGGRPCAGRCWA